MRQTNRPEPNVDDATNRQGSGSRTVWLTVAGFTIVGAAFRISNATQDLFADELATYWIVATNDLAGVVRTVASTAEITPPLSFMLSWLTTRPGLSPELVRLPALVAGIASVPLVYVLGARTVGPRAALLAAALTALSPFMILYSAEARGYGVLMALVGFSTLALLAAITSGQPIWWAAHGALVCLAMYTHYTAVFVLATQAAWAWWHHPAQRRRLLAATGIAAVLYVPWLPSLRGDIESPTTDILSAFSPLSLGMVGETLAHWSIGFPYIFPSTTLRDLPGLLPIVMLAVSLAMGVHGIVGRRAARRPVSTVEGSGGLGLVVLLAVATPVGTFLQSVVSTNVFSVRSLAASWPYLALVAAAVITASSRRTQLLACILAVGSFAVGAMTMLGTDFRRPDFVRVARFADAHGAAVVINGAVLPPGPLTNFEVEESSPDAPVFRLNAPEQTDRPFGVFDFVPDPADVVRRAVRAAEGGPIVVVSLGHAAEIMTLIESLAAGYTVTDELEVQGLYLFDLRAVLLEQHADE